MEMTILNTKTSASKAMKSVLGEDEAMMSAVARVGEALASAGRSRGMFAAMIEKEDLRVTMSVLARVSADLQQGDL